MKTGRLLYRCRSCGQIERPFMVKDITMAMASLCVIGRTTEDMGPMIATMTTVHPCSTGHLGIADMIGGEEDPDPSTSEETTP